MFCHIHDNNLDTGYSGIMISLCAMDPLFFLFVFLLLLFFLFLNIGIEKEYIIHCDSDAAIYKKAKKRRKQKEKQEKEDPIKKNEITCFPMRFAVCFFANPISGTHSYVWACDLSSSIEKTLIGLCKRDWNLYVMDAFFLPSFLPVFFFFVFICSYIASFWNVTR